MLLISEIKEAAQLYYNAFGMNVNAICGDSIQQRNPYKAPADDDWEIFLDKRIPSARFINQFWDKATGVGVVLGYNDIRAIDIDHIDLTKEENDDLDSWKRDYIQSYPWPRHSAVIREMLQVLGLPEDYEWVVYSGSGEGLHIIFKVSNPNYDISFRSKAYEGDLGVFEFRWRDYLVLPPSANEHGYLYTFRYEQSPKSAPEYVSLDNVFIFLNKYCGKCIKGRNRTDEPIPNLPLHRTIRVLAGDWSGSTPPSSDEEEFNLFRNCSCPDALNYIALEYYYGRFVKQNLSKTKDLLLKARTEDSHINLAVLIAYGILEGSREEMRFHAKIGMPYSTQYGFDASYDREVLKAGNKRLLFIDTETTGLPENFNIPPSDYEKWPRLIQLSWMITDEKGTTLYENNKYVHPDGFIIPDNISYLTGITQDMAKIKGEHYIDVLRKFSRDLERVDLIIAHNIDFDKNVLLAESYRSISESSVILEFEGKAELCTMKSGVDVCKIPSTYGYKYPTLQELYFTLFNSRFEQAHNALADVRATKKCFFEMLHLGIFSIL